MRCLTVILISYKTTVLRDCFQAVWKSQVSAGRKSRSQTLMLPATDDPFIHFCAEPKKNPNRNIAGNTAVRYETSDKILNIHNSLLYITKSVPVDEFIHGLLLFAKKEPTPLYILPCI